LLDAALANNRSLKIAEAQVAKAQADASAASKRQFPVFNTQLFGGPVTEFDFLFRAGVFGAFPTTGPIPRRIRRSTIHRSSPRYSSSRRQSR